MDALSAHDPGAIGWIRRKPRVLALVLVLGYVVLGVATLPRYGLTWDEGLGNLFFGERYCHYFATLDPAYLRFDNPDLPIHRRPFNSFVSPFRYRAFEFPPLADTVSAATMELVAYRLGWLDPVDAFHLPKVLLCGLLLWVLFEFARRRLGTWTALVSVALLGAYPRFWGDMHFNPKDIPGAVLFAFTVIAFVAWRERPSIKRALFVGLLWGCALAVRASALFVPAVLLLAAVPWRLRPPPWAGLRAHVNRYAGHYLLMAALGSAVHFATWPHLFADPWRLRRYYRFIFARAGDGARTHGWDAAVQTFATMPEAVIVLVLLGVVLAIRLRHAREGATLRLLVVWMALPIVRSSLPGTLNYDGIRHFEEFLPAACLLAAYAACIVGEHLRNRWPARRRAAVIGLGVLVAGNFAWALLRYTPYEHLYYNSLAGGLAGANRTHHMSEATDYWASSYRAGMRWLNQTAARDASIHVPVASWLVEMTAPLWLRPDLQVVPAQAIGPALAAARPVYVMFITRPAFYSPVARHCTQHLSPVHEIQVDGLVVLQIYQLTRPPT